MEIHRPGSDIANATRPAQKRTVSVKSLLSAFDEAETAAKGRTHDQLAKLNESSLARTLARDFTTGWGSRLERQWQRFVPVVVAAGEDEEMAIDHLLCTRVIRDGKVTGRHEIIVQRKLELVAEDLQELWMDLGLSGQPQNCLNALERDKQRVEHGG
jgi:hypothetical protein